MAIQSTDIINRLSVTTGSAGNTTAQATPTNSFGKYISTTAITDNTLNNLFPDISGDQNAASQVDYACYFVYNSHGSLTWQAPKVWISGVRCTSNSTGSLVTSNSHGFSNGDAVRVDTDYATDAVPSSLNNTTTYYVISATTNTFQLSATSGGSAITIGTSTGFATRKFGNTTIAIGIDTTAASAVGNASAQALTIASSTTAPAGVSFSSPTTKASGLSLSDLANGNVRAIWIQRTALNAGARNNDGITIKVEGDTAA